MRRLAIGLLAAAGGLTAMSAIGDAAAATDDLAADPTRAVAQDDVDDEPTPPPVDVLQVSGFFDDILVDAVSDAIDGAETNGAQALILQVNSRGAVVDDDEMAALLQQVADADVPVGVWIGPSGARLYGPPAQLLAVADVTAMAPGARVGHTGPPLDVDGVEISFGAATDVLRNDSLGLGDARDLDVFRQRISDEGVPTIANMLDAMDGYEAGGIVVDTTRETVTDDGTVQRETTAIPRFSKLGLVEQLFHTVASPPVTYLLLLAGLGLLVFEFFTAGVGIAGVVGAVSLILACTGLVTLPTRWWAATLILLAFVAFAIDVQVGLPRTWTGIGILLTVVGSFLLFEDLPGTSLRPSWITLIAGIGGVMLTFIVGMPSMTRTRFATPTIGREWMIGEHGTVVERVAPDGVVEVGDGRWPARTNRATPVEVGDEVRVAAIDGITLEIEPLEGAARDYREMRSSRRDPS